VLPKSDSCRSFDLTLVIIKKRNLLNKKPGFIF